MSAAKREKQLRPGGTVQLRRAVPTLAGDWSAGTPLTIEAVWRDAEGWKANVRDRHGRGICCLPVEALAPLAAGVSCDRPANRVA